MEDNKVEGGKLKREIDSLDDFEHLESISPVAEPARDEGINKGVVVPGAAVAHRPFDAATAKPSESSAKMDSNLLEMGDNFPDRKEADAKLDKFLTEISTALPQKTDSVIAATQNFVDMERNLLKDDLLDRYTDSEPEEDFKHAESDDFRKSQELPELSKHDNFKDFDEFIENTPGNYEEKYEKETDMEKNQKFTRDDDVKFETPEPPALVETTKISSEKSPPHHEEFKQSEPVKPVEETARKPLVEEAKKVEEIKQVEDVKKVEEVKKVVEEVKKIEEVKKVEDVKIDEDKKKAEVCVKPKKDVMEAEAMFCKMGLVESLIYWRDPKKSGPIFGGVLLILLSLKFFSLISVVAYVSLLGLAATISFRIYKNIVQAVQKTGDGHPFKEYLETDVALPQQKVEEAIKVAVAHLNATIVELRRLFLVEDLVDSIKFAILLWCFTYLGAWFNGITLIILAWVALFSLPKVYETNKTQIDANLDIVRSKLAEITSKVKAAVPIGKKSEEKKE